MSAKPRFELGGEFEDKNFASCFARSVVVNSQYKQAKSLDGNFVQTINAGEQQLNKSPSFETADGIRLRRNSRKFTANESRRYSYQCNRRQSFISNRISEIPVENIVQQSKIETLQWQLKEIEKSREMYKAVMKQVVTFLEKAHHNLELISSRLNTKQTVPRTKSDHQIAMDKSQEEKMSNSSALEDYMTCRNYTWGRQKKLELAPEEIPPEKLSKEAFRLLRTAQSLLSTQEPDLAQTNSEPENDSEFLAQLAKEFPSTPPLENKPQRATSFSLSPKLIMPDTDLKISTAFNRKLSLQLSEVRRSSKIMHRGAESVRGSVTESENDFLMSDTTPLITPQKSANKYKESEKSNSPATGSISSVEDESGFSSMNSFQDVGLPIVNSTLIDDVSAKNALLRSMLQNNTAISAQSNTTLIENTLLQASVDKFDEEMKKMDDIKLWQKPTTAIEHKRWHSQPVDGKPQAVKVLWV